MPLTEARYRIPGGMWATDTVQKKVNPEKWLPGPGDVCGDRLMVETAPLEDESVQSLQVAANHSPALRLSRAHGDTHIAGSDRVHLARSQG